VVGLAFTGEALASPSDAAAAALSRWTPSCLFPSPGGLLVVVGLTRTEVELACCILFS